MITLLVASFLAGVLTTLAPCVLPLLPVVVGGSLVSDKDSKKSSLRPLIIALSLGISVIISTLALKVATNFIGISPKVWQVFSGGLVLALGIVILFPVLWEKVVYKQPFFKKSQSLAGKASTKSGLGGAVLTGMALGPVFSSCSPTYAYIIAVSFPASFFTGLIYLAFYALGLASALLLVAYAGQGIMEKLRLASNPKGVFKKVIGILFILVGLAVLFGIDKKIQTYVLDQGWYDPISNLEERLR